MLRDTFATIKVPLVVSYTENPDILTQQQNTFLRSFLPLLTPWPSYGCRGSIRRCPMDLSRRYGTRWPLHSRIYACAGSKAWRTYTRRDDPPCMARPALA